MWFWRTAHAYIEIRNRKGLKKKNRALQVRVFHIIHANGGAAASAGRFEIIATRRGIETIATRHIQSKREI